MTTDTMRDRQEAEERLHAIKEAMDTLLAPTRPLYTPTAVELLVALNQRGLKIVRSHGENI
jgi:hypothetical protein